MVSAQVHPQPIPAQGASTAAIDHVTLVVRDFAAARRFYVDALRPLGLGPQLQWPDGQRVHFGLPGEASTLWLVGGEEETAARVALAARDRSAVQAFHGAALAAGGRSLDPPRTRAEHTLRTYAATVAAPDGNVVEAFCWDTH
jgi:catechol 2,3-dioxygenase-like lactoylglutathione lyase family enzyme